MRTFAIRAEHFRQFATEAMQFRDTHFALRVKGKSADSLNKIMVRIEDAAKNKLNFMEVQLDYGQYCFYPA